MPKYTAIQTYVAGTTVTSSDWNQYFGSKGNLQWAYDEYENISAINGGTLLNSAYAATNVSANVVTRFSGYASYRGNSEYLSTSAGTIMPSVYTGYAWVSATVTHEVVGGPTSNTPGFYICLLPMNDTLAGLTVLTDTIYKRGYSTNNAQSSGITSWGLWPINKTATYSTIVQIRDGFTKFQVAVYRTDAAIAAGNNFRCTEFTVLPLGDVSGMVNVLDLLTVVE
jgi:hypothetical protein